MQAGRGELLQRLTSKLHDWAPLLQRFLKSQDEQVSIALHCAACMTMHICTATVIPPCTRWSCREESHVAATNMRTIKQAALTFL